jgi:hypothetical protein
MKKLEFKQVTSLRHFIGNIVTFAENREDLERWCTIQGHWDEIDKGVYTAIILVDGFSKYQYIIVNNFRLVIGGPIEDNRIVSNTTFATRFSNFLKNITVSDAASWEELEYLQRVAEQLIKHQVITVSDPHEIKYLTEMGHYPLKREFIYTTFDGVQLFEGDKYTLYSCMKDLPTGDAKMKNVVFNKRFFDSANPNRIFFHSEEECDKYILNNTKKYSENDLKKMIDDEFEKLCGVLEELGQSKNYLLDDIKKLRNDK